MSLLREMYSLIQEGQELPDAEYYEVFDKDRSRVISTRDAAEALRALKGLKKDGMMMAFTGNTGKLAASLVNGKFLDAKASKARLKSDPKRPGWMRSKSA